MIAFLMKWDASIAKEIYHLQKGELTGMVDEGIRNVI
jgi:hypothetical protein